MIEIILVGDELISGSTLDQNANFIARQLYAQGHEVRRITVVGDGTEDIVRALRSPLPDTRFIIVTGGLGPTDDDRTAAAAAAAFGRHIRLNDEALGLMQQRFAELGRSMNEANRKQAMLPEDCRVIPNPVGTACGFIVQSAALNAVFLPGVPEETRAITESFLTGYIREGTGDRTFVRNKTLKVFGLWESAIHEKLAGALPEGGSVTLGFYPQYPEVSLRLSARGSDPAAIERELEAFQAVLYERLGDSIYADNDRMLEDVVGELLKTRGETVAVAESCTGGLISNRLTNVPGSSAYLDRSVVVYSNRSKEELLQVPGPTLTRYGAVSEQTARSMAEGVRRLADATYGVAVTGIAGPDGGSAEKPVGTVWVAVSSEKELSATRHRFTGGREKIKLMSSQTALSALRLQILKQAAD